MKAFNVYRNRHLIDTVFWNARADGGARTTAKDVKESLINHDGYPSDIEVFARREAPRHHPYPA